MGAAYCPARGEAVGTGAGDQQLEQEVVGPGSVRRWLRLP